MTEAYYSFDRHSQFETDQAQRDEANHLIDDCAQAADRFGARRFPAKSTPVPTIAQLPAAGSHHSAVIPNCHEF
ncbi:hypothetical protein [Actinopolyspora xinjiangensis]|nr:hypothetical protein [Actinopolyspora xinjiangensis]